MWFEYFLILMNNSSSAELRMASNVCESDISANVHRSDRAARRRTALIRCRLKECSHSSYLECCLPVHFPRVNTLPQCALKPAVVLEATETFWNDLGRSGVRLLCVQWRYMRVLFDIQVLRQNSETNWRRYSGEQFELSLAMKWIWRLLPSHMTFHCLQTDATDKRDITRAIPCSGDILSISVTVILAVSVSVKRRHSVFDAQNFNQNAQKRKTVRQVTSFNAIYRRPRRPHLSQVADNRQRRHNACHVICQQTVLASSAGNNMCWKRSSVKCSSRNIENGYVLRRKAYCRSACWYQKQLNFCLSTLYIVSVAFCNWFADVHHYAVLITLKYDFHQVLEVEKVAVRFLPTNVAL